MAFKYRKVVPWGRSFREYSWMFDLRDGDLQRSILGCADGPASFNVEMFRRGRRVISCDPLYFLTTEQIKLRIDATYNDVIRQTRQNQEKFVWSHISSVDELGQLRLAAMSDFIDDFARSKQEGRYIPAELPHLPFAASAFELALCSHFLFLYSDSLSLDFHRQAVDELCRVANEVRIFPLLTYNAEPSSLVDQIAEHLSKAGRTVTIEKVAYEFQRGGDQMMRILR
jgi:hypothetical protein